MRLLVSVRSAAEAVAALDGAAHIIDAKEPEHGPLGAVGPEALAEILARMPHNHPFSVALGDFTTAKEVYASVHGLGLPRHHGPTFLKIGFANARTASVVTDLVTTAREAASGGAEPARVIAVAYADAARVDAPDPWDVCEAARRGGAAGVLIDTACKDGSKLLDLMPVGELADWVSLAHLHELTAGIAGSLDAESLGAVTLTGADIIGVRGAACDGGRTGTITAQRVATLLAALRNSDLDFGETPDPLTDPEPGLGLNLL